MKIEIDAEKLGSLMEALRRAGTAIHESARKRITITEGKPFPLRLTNGPNEYGTSAPHRLGGG
jgi:hypothetical protein